jgi:hypothetical protein
MKTMIYASIGLFSIATLYGIADYNKSKKTGALERLYVEEEPVSNEVSTLKPARVVNTSLVVKPNDATNKTVSKRSAGTGEARRSLRLEDYSRGKIGEEYLPGIETAALPIGKVSPVKEEIKTAAPKLKSIKIKRSKPARKIKLEMFSRGKPEAPVKKD